MIKELLKTISDENKEGFVSFERLEESYYEDEEVDARHVNGDIKKREAQVTADMAKLIFDIVEANARISGKKVKDSISKDKVNKEIKRMQRVIHFKVTRMVKCLLDSNDECEDKK